MTATIRPAPRPAFKLLSRLSDDHLVDLCRTGDERAFEALVRRHRHELQVYAGRLLGAEGRSEDVLQHALMSAWVALRDRDTAVANPRAWLYGIVHNSAVTVLRRAQHDTVELDDARDAADAHGGPETGVVVGEILAELARLPEPQRRALLMTAVAGSSHEEAASALGVSGGAVRGMVYRARAALRHAAAGVLPAPLWHWAARLGHRRSALPVDPTDAATAVTSASAASAGVAAVVVKGGAIVAAVGALTAAGGALPSVGSQRAHHRPAAVQQVSIPARPPVAVTPTRSATALGDHSTGSGEGGGADDRRADRGASGRAERRGRGGGSRHGSSSSGGSSNSTGSSGSGRSGTPGGGSGSSGGGSGGSHGDSGRSGGGRSGSGR